MSASAAGSRPRAVIVSPTLLIGVACLIATVLGVTLLGSGRAAGPGLKPLVEHRLLRFDDREDGAVIVRDAQTGGVIDTVVGQQGFLRQTMRGLALVRAAQGYSQEPPFELDYYADHRLILRDLATKRTIELEAFGPTNEAVFARYLPASGTAGGASTGLATATASGDTVR